MRNLLVFIGCTLLCTSYLSAQSKAQQDEVIYHVVQRSFYDSNGDLHGDLNGLREKLDYLQDLGVTSILLLPLYHSEYYHNYFATDFETIDPEFGTMEDYHGLIRDLHHRGMKLYMDMETQYVTEDHIWYQNSIGNPGSPFTEYLIYNGPNNTEPESIIFDLTALPGYNGITRKVTTVNLLNEKVLDYNFNLFRYWVDPNGDGDFSDGVDGFRLDHMMDDLDWKGKLTGLFEKFWSPLIDRLRTENPKLTFIAEQADWASYGLEYLEHGKVDRVFGFNFLQAITALNKKEIVKAAEKTFDLMPDDKQVIVMIENHDIDRYASVVARDPGKLKVGAALNLLIGGTPLVYYGQEIGMTGMGGFGKFGNTDANDIPRREAFEWYQTTTGKGMALWYKDTGLWWDQTNLKDDDGISYAEQVNDPQSLWNVYRELIALRKTYPALSSGEFRNIDNANSAVLSFLRVDASDSMLILINLSADHHVVNVEHQDVDPDIKVVYGTGKHTQQKNLLTFDLPGYGIVVAK